MSDSDYKVVFPPPSKLLLKPPPLFSGNDKVKTEMLQIIEKRIDEFNKADDELSNFKVFNNLMLVAYEYLGRYYEPLYQRRVLGYINEYIEYITKWIEYVELEYRIDTREQYFNKKYLHFKTPEMQEIIQEKISALKEHLDVFTRLYTVHIEPGTSKGEFGRMLDQCHQWQKNENDSGKKYKLQIKFLQIMLEYFDTYSPTHSAVNYAIEIARKFHASSVSDKSKLDKYISELAEFINQEDRYDFNDELSEISHLGERSPFTSNSCRNKDMIMDEEFTVDNDNDVFIMFMQKSNSSIFENAGTCASKNELKEYIKSDLNVDNPQILMTLWTGENLDQQGKFGKPTGKIVVKIPPYNIYVTYGSLEKMMKNDYNKEWYLYPLYNGKRRRIGNIQGSYGSSQNHGQIPGSIIYKAYTEKQITKNTQIKEEYSDYPLFMYENFQPLQQIFNDLSVKRLADALITNLI